MNGDYIWGPIMIFALLAFFGVMLTSCTFPVSDPLGREFAMCHVGAFEPSFCDVHKADKDDTVVTGAGAIATFNTSGSVASEGVAIGTLLAK